MKTRLAAIGFAAALAISAISGASAFAPQPDDNPNNDNGQANAIANCRENILKQNGNGQTGANTGSDNDEKQLATAVTNCDHFWATFGSNP